MKAYVAGRQKHAPLVREVQKLLTAHGHEVTFDWSNEKNLVPYKKNRAEATRVARLSLIGCRDADIFVLLWEDSLYGALIELGVVLATSTPEKPKKIFLLGSKSRQCIFEMLPEFQTIETIADLQKALVELKR